MNRFFPNSFFAALILTIVSVIFSSILLVIADSLFEFQPSPYTVALLFCFNIIIVTVIVNKRRSLPLFSYYSNTLCGIGWAFLAILLFNIFINKPVALLLSDLCPLPGSTAQNVHGIFQVCSICILSPIIEETIFRGIFLRGFMERYSAKHAIFLSALFFAIIHVVPSQVFSAICLGIFFGFVFYKTSSLLYTIILHMVANSTILISSAIPYESIPMPHIIVSSILVTVVLFIILRKLIHTLVQSRRSVLPASKKV